MKKPNFIHLNWLTIRRFFHLFLLIFVLLPGFFSGPPQPVQAVADRIRVDQAQSNLQLAINIVPDGGTIEISSGVYYPPPGGFVIDNLPKTFSIQAAPGASVYLDGNHTTDILRYANINPPNNYSIFFKGIIFRNGFSTTGGIAGGVTIKRARATFISCTFTNNYASSTSGGGVYLEDRAIVYFYNSIWSNNITTVGGGGLGMRTGVVAYVNNSQFVNNRVNPPNHSFISSGGAIYVADSVLRITDTLFLGNQAGAHGGAIYGIGTWQNPRSVPHTDILITNSSFINNATLRDASVQGGFPMEGGAINVEDQTLLKIYNSRFITNNAQIGGGVNGFRAQVEIYKSVFKGNTALDPTNPGSGYGGSISLTSNDGVSDGYDNKPSGRLIVEDSFFLGRFGSITNNARAAGCIHARGDTSRVEASSGIPNIGTLDENRSLVILRRVVLDDCDINLENYGGGASFALVNLTIEDSIIANCDSLGGPYSGAGGIAILINSKANISRTIFAKNTTAGFGGAVFTQGSEVHIHDSQFFQNEVSPGVIEPYAQSYGAAIFTSGDWSRILDGKDLIENNIFSNNIGITLFDDDRNLWGMSINSAVYNGNQFYETTYGANKVYRSALSVYCTPNELNNLTIIRSQQNLNSAKSTIKNNTGLSSIPNISKILSIPPNLLQKLSNGETNQPEAYIMYAWSGSQATLDGSSTPNNIGYSTYTTPGTHTLRQNGVDYSVSHTLSSIPRVSLFALGEDSVNLKWSTQTGTYLDGMIDHGVTGSLPLSGSANILSADGVNYSFFAAMEEGGAMVTEKTGTLVFYIPFVKK